MTLQRSLLLALVLALPGLSARAARPMTTDDARIVDAKACQVESWLRVNKLGPHAFWAVPACSPVENLELTLGSALVRQGQQLRSADSLEQGKLVLRPLKPNDWGWAVSLGRSIEREPETGHRRAPSNYLNVPISWSRQDDAVLLHLNLGLRHDRAENRRHTTWGLSSELQIRPGLQLIAESHGESGNRPFVHGGLRYWLVPERVQLDATYGSQARWASQQRWITVGVRLMTPAFLP